MAFPERIYNLDTVPPPRQAGREGSVATKVACSVIGGLPAQEIKIIAR